MTTINVNEIGIFKCKFLGLKTCKNPDYAMLQVAFEVKLNDLILNWDTLPNQKSLLIESKNINKFAGLVPNKIYHFKMACKFQGASSRNGKNYPPTINYEPIEVMGEARIENAA